MSEMFQIQLIKQYIDYFCFIERLPPNSATQKSTRVLSHLVSEGQVSGSGLAEHFWLRVAPEVVVKLLASAMVISGLSWSWRISDNSKVTHIVSGRPPFLAGCWPQTSVPHQVGLSMGLLTTWQLASPRESDLREWQVKESSKWQLQSFITYSQK